MTVIVCDGGPKTWVRRIVLCPTENKRRRWIGFYQEWYGVTWTCCGCGDSFAEGYRLERPFKPGWRREAITKAKRQWTESF